MSTDSNRYSNAEESNAPRPYSQSRSTRNQLTDEEVKILMECNNESFYYRCVPFAFAAMTGTYLAYKKGYVKPHPKYGLAFKQLAALSTGWFIGKLSYRRVCEDKFLRLQNSPVADAIRKKRGIYHESQQSDYSSDEAPMQRSPMSSFSSDQDYHSSYASLNLDTDKNENKYSDLDARSSFDSEYSLEGSKEDSDRKPRPTVSYDELRMKNRIENARSMAPPPPPASQPSSASISKWDNYGPSTRRDNLNREDPKSGVTIKNTYGDTWEK